MIPFSVHRSWSSLAARRQMTLTSRFPRHSNSHLKRFTKNSVKNFTSAFYEPGRGQLYTEPHVRPISCHVTSLPWQQLEELNNFFRRRSLIEIETSHTHAFNSPLSGTTWVNQYPNCKTSLDFTEARDSEWQWHQLAPVQVCTSLQTDNHAGTPPLSFLQAGCPSCRPTNSIKALIKT